MSGIVLVEDNPNDELLTRRALARHGSGDEVVVLRDGAEAVDYLLDPQLTVPAVVLLDLKLPKVDGLAVLARIRENRRTRFVPVVVLTSSDEESDIVGSYRNGANSFVRKPVDSDDFDSAIERLGVYWTRLNRPVPERLSN